VKLISPLVTFAFVTFERWLQNFGDFWADSKFQSFALFDGKSYKSQYRSYLVLTYFELNLMCTIFIIRNLSVKPILYSKPWSFCLIKLWQHNVGMKFWWLHPISFVYKQVNDKPFWTTFGVYLLAEWKWS
jgi:hypothetical protein